MESFHELVRRARGGDARAFEDIVRRLTPQAVGTAHMITGDRHRGQEAAQDAFVAAWRRLETLRDDRAFRAWFARILTRAAIASRRRRPSVSMDDVPELAARPEPIEEATLPRIALGLKARYRDVLALRYVNGLSHQEISAALSISPARVKSRLHDGREQLRRRLLERGREY
jgi:RNA polymerase sigma-70 factor (ECF subfamily)